MDSALLNSERTSSFALLDPIQASVWGIGAGTKDTVGPMDGGAQSSDEGKHKSCSPDASAQEITGFHPSIGLPSIAVKILTKEPASL